MRWKWWYETGRAAPETRWLYPDPALGAAAWMAERDYEGGEMSEPEERLDRIWIPEEAFQQLSGEIYYFLPNGRMIRIHVSGDGWDITRSSKDNPIAFVLREKTVAFIMLWIFIAPLVCGLMNLHTDGIGWSEFGTSAVVSTALSYAITWYSYHRRALKLSKT